MTAPYGPPPTLGRLVVDCSRHPLSFGMPGPTVVINGHPVKVQWGQAPFTPQQKTRGVAVTVTFLVLVFVLAFLFVFLVR